MSRIVLYEGTFLAEFKAFRLLAVGETHLDDYTYFHCQVNGLLGTAAPADAILITGIHTGDFWIRVLLADEQPMLDSKWEEVVEAPWELRLQGGAELCELLASRAVSLPIPPNQYRLRYCALNFGKARDVENEYGADGQCIEQYELAFWPAARAPDAVIRANSADAKHHHQNLPTFGTRPIAPA